MKLHHTKLEKRGKGIALVCDCCSYPFAHIRFDKLLVSSRHGKEHHLNYLTASDLRALASFLEAQQQLSKVEKAA